MSTRRRKLAPRNSPGCGAARHAGGAAEEAAAFRRNGQNPSMPPQRAVPGWSRWCGAARRGVIAKSFGRRRRPGRPDSRVGESKAEKRSSTALMEDTGAGRRPPSARKEGDPTSHRRCGSQDFGDYSLPRTRPEPMPHVDANGCEIWAGDQFVTIDQIMPSHRGLKPGKSAFTPVPAAASAGVPIWVGTSSRRFDRQGIRR